MTGSTERQVATLCVAGAFQSDTLLPETGLEGGITQNLHVIIPQGKMRLQKGQASSASEVRLSLMMLHHTEIYEPEEVREVMMAQFSCAFPSAEEWVSSKVSSLAK